jgi:hypothetical protein
MYELFGAEWQSYSKWLIRKDVESVDYFKILFKRPSEVRKKIHENCSHIDGGVAEIRTRSFSNTNSTASINHALLLHKKA